jgi:hypothetical protein
VRTQLLPSAVIAWTTVQGAVLWWPKPTQPAWGSAIFGSDVAAAVRRNGVDDGARRRVVVAKANASSVRQRHC